MTVTLRIALFTYATKPRGSVIHTLELATALHHLGHSVTVYALDKEGTGFDYPLPCQSYLIPSQPVTEGIDQLIRQRIQEFVDFLDESHLQSHSYDCYHAQDCISANALLALRTAGKIPHFIRTVHHVESFNSPYLQACQDRSILEPDRCLSVSNDCQKELQQKYAIAAPRVINAINGDRFSPIPNGTETALKHHLGITGSPIYLTVGGIEPRKNSLLLLQAFSRVLTRHPQAQLIIAGGATLFDYQPYRDEFFTLAHHLGIEVGRSPLQGTARQPLLLPGVIPDSDLPALYRCADAFVFPSVKEGWGLVVLEAIASGLPVITANQPPFTEFLHPDQALLVDPSSPEAIAHAMEQIVQPEVAQKLIPNSRLVCDRYTWETSARMHVEQYCQFR
jgi:glycosyltransferase-like protein